MHNEFIIKAASREFRVFLQNGFYKTKQISPLHKHNYADIHIVSGGGAIFTVGTQTLNIKSGDVVVIPANTFHACVSLDENASHTAFQINLKGSELSIINIEEAIIAEFFRQIEIATASNNYTIVLSYISLICCYFLTEEDTPAKQISDYGFLIHDFLSTKYGNDIRLKELADALHLSERQTERLVIEHTGKSFRKVLSEIRVDIAKYLLENTSMTSREVAEYVGYRSYAGFWKVMKEYNK